MAGIWTSAARRRCSSHRGRPRAAGLHRALRAPANRSADERPAAPLWAPLPHAHCQARLRGDVPRSGGLLALGAGDRDDLLHVVHSARPGRDGGRQRRVRREDVQPRSRPWLGDERDRLQSVLGARVQDPASHCRGDDSSRRHVVVRARHRDGHPRRGRPVPPYESQHSRKIGEPTPNPLATPRPNPTAQPASLGIGSLRTMMARLDESAADARGARGSSRAE